MTRFAIICAFVAVALFPVSVARAEDFGTRFPELRLNLSPSSSPASTSFLAPSASALASTKPSSHFSSQLFAPVASSTIRPTATTDFSLYSPLVGLRDDLQTAVPTSGPYSDVLRAPATPSTATGSLIQPLALPSFGASESSYFRESSAPFGAAYANQPAAFSYR